ncbi:hypothetical protein AA12717_3117 [Gluconacetobacter sacchari DSM 12717]|uniref:Uncharacterized protein n=1 Tax=Gluconacetobacter sacchari DSM 12717 TaxID=1307940 RepID=A0ABQ0PAF2_9PROT|nr:hypothetical protein AA12717_3117 [Gluconacetobacter sacchari DSM 12717]
MERISSSTDPSGAGSDRASVDERDSRLSSAAMAGLLSVWGPGSGRAALAGTMPQKEGEANIRHPWRGTPGGRRLHTDRRVA